MDNANVKKMFFLALFLGLFLLVARLFYPFLTVLLWSGLLYVILLPLYNRLCARRGKAIKPGMRHFFAGLLSVAGVLLIVLPLAFIAFNTVKQVGELSRGIFRAIERHPEWLDLSPNGTVGGLVSRITNGDVDLSSVDLRGEILHWLGGSTQRILGISGAILRNAALFVLALAFMVFTLYFLFVDGGHLIKVLIGAIPIEREYTRLFVRTMRDTTKHLVRGYLLVALYQSVAAFIIFSLFKVKGPLVLALFTGICSFIPMVGASLVWLPVGLIHMAAHGLLPGLALIVCSGFFISIVDNFLRPFFLSDRLNVHPLLIFFSILGGINLFGFNGLILGPLILILFFAALELYDKIYRSADPEVVKRGENGGGTNESSIGDGGE